MTTIIVKKNGYFLTLLNSSFQQKIDVCKLEKQR